MSACPKGLLFVATLLTLLVAANGEGWQGAGNWTSSNLTDIWTFIHANYFDLPPKGGSINFDQTTAVEKFVTYLNGLWDSSWNVVVLDTIASSDAVLYGYAFNGHWYWFNGYVSGSYVFGFVIWKDFKCGGYQTVGYKAILTKNLDQTSTRNQYLNAVEEFPTGYTLNIWDLASKFMKSLMLKPYFNKGDYAVVMSNDASNTYFYARVCMVGTNYTYYNFGTDNNGKYYGKTLLLQTRQL